MLSKKEVSQIKEELENCQNPLFFFDDDADGLCSFLLLYRLVKEGHGVMVKSVPNLDARFLRKVEEYNPDKIFVTDVPIVEQEFIDGAKRKIIWIDHHPPVERQGISYFNPRKQKKDVYIPATRLCYEVVKQDEWIAAVGCVGDGYLPDFPVEEWTDLGGKNVWEVMYTHPLGKLVQIFSFILKGKTTDINQSIRVLTRIKSPSEIINGETAQGKFILKRYEKIAQEYESLRDRAMKKAGKDKIFLFVYQEQENSFTSDLAGELLYRHPDKIVVVAREKGGELKTSFRAKIAVEPAMQRALVGVEGRGGGHENACAAVVKKEDFERFMENFKRELEKDA